jgi:Tol biopolymer transport system component
MAPDWSPDGKRLAYKYFAGTEARAQGPAIISVFDFGTGEELQVATGLSSAIILLGPRWAPDGRSVLLVGSRVPEETGIYQVDIPGGAVKLLVKFPPQKYCLQTAWSPDAKSIFYTLGNPVKVLRRDLESGQDIELASMNGPVGLPRIALSPDGKWLAFTSIDMMNEPRKLMLIPAAGGSAREIYRTNAGDSVQCIFWTVDGQSIWLKKYTNPLDDKGKPTIEFLSVSPDGQNVRKLEMSVLGAMDLRLHPDGRQGAFWTGQSKLELWALENFLPDKK